MRRQKDRQAKMHHFPFDLSTNRSPNPYFIPWEMKNLLDRVDRELNTPADHDLKQELKEILQEFPNWKPADKLAKELRYKLEPITVKSLL